MNNIVVDSVCHWFSIFVAVWAVAQAILLGISCIPAAAIMPVVACKCFNTMGVWYVSSALNIVTDLLIFVIPLPCVYCMRLPKYQKTL
ncbi:Glycine cleavage system H protein, mitochondrial, partial [Madurella mycetomatis]